MTDEETSRRELVLDLHGYHPHDVGLAKIAEQAWEMGAERIQLIHGHGRARGLSPGFVNTNTGARAISARSSSTSQSTANLFSCARSIVRLSSASDQTPLHAARL